MCCTCGGNKTEFHVISSEKANLAEPDDIIALIPSSLQAEIEGDIFTKKEMKNV